MTYNVDEVHPYLIKVSIRNNLIIRAIYAAGYKNVSQFCEQNGMAKTQLTDLISLRAPPLTKEGEFRESAKKLMENLCALPTDLWTSEQLTMELKRNTNTKEVSLDAMLSVLGINAEEALRMIEPPKPDDILEEKEKTAVINEILESLTPKEEKVLRMRFGLECDEHTLEETGKKLRVTKERIRQIEAKAIRKIKHPARAVELRKLLPEYEKSPYQKSTVEQPFCKHKNHQFYINQNYVSVCAHCGIRETIWKKRYE